MPPQPPKYHDPVRLKTACIINGQYYRQGEVLPFAAEHELPENLKALIATGEEEEPFDPAERNFYDLPPHLRRQARAVRGNVLLQEENEAFAEAHQRLPEDVQAALEDAHALHVAKVKAQMLVNQYSTDSVVARAEAEATARIIQFYVKRGGEFARVERAKLRPGEQCFTRQGDEWVYAGVIDSRGEPPPQPITT